MINKSNYAQPWNEQRKFQLVINPPTLEAQATDSITECQTSSDNCGESVLKSVKVISGTSKEAAECRKDCSPTLAINSSNNASVFQPESSPLQNFTTSTHEVIVSALHSLFKLGDCLSLTAIVSTFQLLWKERQASGNRAYSTAYSYLEELQKQSVYTSSYEIAISFGLLHCELLFGYIPMPFHSSLRGRYWFIHQLTMKVKQSLINVFPNGEETLESISTIYKEALLFISQKHQKKKTSKKTDEEAASSVSSQEYIPPIEDSFGIDAVTLSQLQLFQQYAQILTAMYGDFLIYRLSVLTHDETSFLTNWCLKKKIISASTSFFYNLCSTTRRLLRIYEPLLNTLEFASKIIIASNASELPSTRESYQCLFVYASLRLELIALSTTVLYTIARATTEFLIACCVEKKMATADLDTETLWSTWISFGKPLRILHQRTNDINEQLSPAVKIHENYLLEKSASVSKPLIFLELLPVPSPKLLNMLAFLGKNSSFATPITEEFKPIATLCEDILNECNAPFTPEKALQKYLLCSKYKEHNGDCKNETVSSSTDSKHVTATNSVIEAFDSDFTELLANSRESGSVPDGTNSARKEKTPSKKETNLPLLQKPTVRLPPAEKSWKFSQKHQVTEQASTVVPAQKTATTRSKKVCKTQGPSVVVIPTLEHGVPYAVCKDNFDNDRNQEVNNIPFAAHWPNSYANQQPSPLSKNYTAALQPSEFLFQTKPSFDIKQPAPMNGVSKCLMQKQSHYDWEIDFNELTLEEKIGAGATSTVYRGIWHGTEVAVKKMTSSLVDTKEMQKFMREIQILLKLRHPNLALLMGASFRSRPYFVVMEYCEGGDLFTLLHLPESSPHRINQLSIAQKLKIAVDIAKGMTYLHKLSPQVIHRDLKSLNILLTNVLRSSKDEPCAKITDFGLSQLRTAQTSEVYQTAAIGTFHWMAPEVLMSRPYNESADVYSFGILLYEIFSQTIPYASTVTLRNFSGSNGSSTNTSNPVNIALAVCQGMRPDITQIARDVPSAIMSLMICCWNPQSFKRPSFEEILSVLKQVSQSPVFH